MSRGLTRYWRSRSIYASWWHWLKSGYSRVLIKVPRFLPFRRRIVQVVLQGDSQPLHLRLGSTDFWVLEEIFAENEYGMVPDDTVRPGGLVVDLGANIGLSVRYWQNRWPSCRVVAVEPHPENAKLCALNAPALREAGECRLIEACVGATARRASIVTDYGDWAHKLAPLGLPGGQAVNVITITSKPNESSRPPSCVSRPRPCSAACP
jgi:FkbM family methyltransferase